MDAYNEEGVEQVVLMKSAQCGATEMLLNIVGYHIDHDPGPIMVMLPTLELGQAWSKDRLMPMLRDSPCLQGKVGDGRTIALSRISNEVKHKNFPGGHITLVGANSAAGLSMRPIRILLCDEVDRYPVSAGVEGDPITLARKRTTGFAYSRRLVMVSTPSIKGASRIEIAWDGSDQRFFIVPCPLCGHEQKLEWKQVKWSAPFGDGTPTSARYYCCQCESPWDDALRWQAVSNGKWVASKPFTGTAGFHVNEFYSSFVRLSEPVKSFLESKDYPELLKVWTNTVLGEPFEESAEKVDAFGLMNRREDWGELAPAEIMLITCGVDVQGDRLEVTRIGWGLQEECWVLEHKIILGDPSGTAIWQELDNYLLTATPIADGKSISVAAAAIDSGGHYADAVHAFARSRLHRRIYGIKGDEGPRPVWPRSASKTKKGTDKVYIVGVDTAKDAVYGRLRTNLPGAGYIHFSNTLDVEWFNQLTSETVKTKYRKGFPTRVWEPKPGVRTEALDCMVYGFAALRSMVVSWDQLKRNLGRKPTPAASTPVASPALAEPAEIVVDEPSASVLKRQASGRRPARIVLSPFLVRR